MTINKNSVEQINVALLDMDKKIKSAMSNGTSASDFKNLEASVDSIKRALNETKTGLEPGKTYNINISGNAATATKATTAAIAETATTAETATNANSALTADTATNATTATKVSNALTVNGKTYDGSSAVDAGVQTVANGGTGVTTQADINKAFIGNLDVGISDVTDGTEFVSSYASDNGFAETAEGAVNVPFKRKFSAVWGYIKGKISSVLGLTKDNYGGKAASAGTADRATGINYTGESESCISAEQTPESFNNSDASWASYIICNHVDGKTYYHQMLRFPFWSDTIQFQRRVEGKLQGWKTVAIMENENTWPGRQNFTTAKASSKMVIPIGAPSSLEDGCIWIER